MLVPVAAAPATLGDIQVYLDGLGSVTPFYTVSVHSRVDGQLMNVYFTEGQFVKAGETLLQIDPRPFQVMLEQAEGQMAHDQALLANSKVDLARYQTLLAQDAIPKQQLDTQVSTVAQYEGATKTDQGAIDNAKLQIAYCHIAAPISGRIGLRLVDPGNMVHASDTNPLLVITQVQPITVLFTLPEDSLPPVLQKLRGGARLPVTAYNRDKSQKLDSGYLLTTDNQIDQTTGTLRLKAVFENRNGMLFPQQFVNVRLLVDTRRKQVLVPAVAIQRGAQGTYVYVVKPDSTADVRVVTAGVSEGGNTAIDQGIEVGENVVIDGADKLQPGTTVTVRTPTGAPTGNGPGGRPSRGAKGGPAA
jgi:multidrug efflux system membrane fusion protein